MFDNQNDAILAAQRRTEKSVHVYMNIASGRFFLSSLGNLAERNDGLRLHATIEWHSRVVLK